jgi:hypothetical protein
MTRPRSASAARDRDHFAVRWFVPRARAPGARGRERDGKPERFEARRRCSARARGADERRPLALTTTTPPPPPITTQPQDNKPRNNMSKEMKARLRQEYVGFGGAENKVSFV